MHSIHLCTVYTPVPTTWPLTSACCSISTIASGHPPTRLARLTLSPRTRPPVGRFLEYMRNYSHPNMEVAYFAERSIEDEIARESESDTTTVLISYLIMFAYISIALGQYNGSSRLLVSGARGAAEEGKGELGTAGPGRVG